MRRRFPLFVVCFVVVAAQQYALLILMHDGQHSLLHRRREINNLISKWLIGAPCGTPFFSSQKQHLTHHRTLGSSTEDPAFQFYCYGEPSPKATAGGLAMHFVKVILVSRFTYSLKGKATTAERLRRSRSPTGFVNTFPSCLPRDSFSWRSPWPASGGDTSCCGCCRW